MMKRISAAFLAIFMVIALCGCSLTTQEVRTVTVETEVPPTMLFLGDSIAAGYGLEGYTSTDNYNCRSYSNLLKDKYTKELDGICEHKMINEAVSGATSDDLVELLNTGKLDDALAESDAVVVSIGGNDMLHIFFRLFDSLGISADKSFNLDGVNLIAAAAALVTMDSEIDTALEHYEENLKTIAEMINDRTDGQLFIQTLYNPLETFEKIKILVDFSDKKIEIFNNIIKDNASLGYEVIDLAPDFEGRCGDLTRIGDYDIHPNDEGHILIAQIVDRSFREHGFTVETTEYGEPHITLSTILLIAGGLCAMFLIVTLLMPYMLKKSIPEPEETEDQEKKVDLTKKNNTPE